MLQTMEQQRPYGNNMLSEFKKQRGVALGNKVGPDPGGPCRLLEENCLAC